MRTFIHHGWDLISQREIPFAIIWPNWLLLDSGWVEDMETYPYYTYKVPSKHITLWNFSDSLNPPDSVRFYKTVRTVGSRLIVRFCKRPGRSGQCGEQSWNSLVFIPARATFRVLFFLSFREQKRLGTFQQIFQGKNVQHPFMNQI